MKKMLVFLLLFGGFFNEAFSTDYTKKFIQIFMPADKILMQDKVDLVFLAKCALPNTSKVNCAVCEGFMENFIKILIELDSWYEEGCLNCAQPISDLKTKIKKYLGVVLCESSSSNGLVSKLNRFEREIASINS